jgi:drug/metabolite transporter (DMT)-like permease
MRTKSPLQVKSPPITGNRFWPDNKNRSERPIASVYSFYFKRIFAVMSPANILRLIALAAIWGGSFLFMRIAAPVLGPVWLVTARVSLAALLLLGIGLWTRKSLDIKSHWFYFLMLGLFNSALPFMLFAAAARTVPGSLLSVLNATAPIWGALITAVMTRTSLSLKTIAGLGIGVLGVAVLVGLDPAHLNLASAVAIGMGLCASFSYGIASYYARSAKKTMAPLDNAHGSMWAIGATLALGLVCSGIAYIIYFRLIDEIGPAPALSVTFLVPVFGVLWGALILGEHVGLNTFVGTALVLSATGLITGFNPAILFRSAKVPAQ